ncbi:Z1 domain-containing protein [Isoptericola sp. BMS4]|uniref:Z1 domain-containing protein n=1 Tax=Isoptericola sp. BMS4 TaxID=2527875 RepID=UPI00141E06ED|nr:Z1 domain-containing protein [Isoptericola sp. BMS4]
MSDILTDAVVRAMRSMQGFEPQPLLDDVLHHLRRYDETLTEDELVEMITSADPNDQARLAFHVQLNRWDAGDADGWTQTTEPRTAERRALVLELLELGDEARAAVDAAYPLDLGAVVIAGDKPEDWDPWYTDAIAAERSFYWAGYRRVLERKMSGDAVNELDRVTHEVVRRLADPTRREPYQSKGLVVGHVQSGKTANFTGVVAKAVDAGYRLVIVLTGTIELLRGQTQRRIDMELVGEENILGGRDKNDPDQVRDIDYAGSGDLDWLAGKFVRYGGDPKRQRRPGIRRLTNASGDYRSLKTGLGYLDYRDTDPFADPAKPLYDPTNLFGTDIRLAVVKKNSSVLKKLVKDLKAIKADLREIPALIIDDEADQASINTTDPRKDTPERRERTAINRLIAQLLGELPRAQYIGYTATPFANVFVDPDDAEDVFPKDFIVSLDPPAAYMGGRQFHDLDREPDEPVSDDPADSNEAAFVRDLLAAPDDEDARRLEIRNALDAFVLSGALKLQRAARGDEGDFHHHTMLVHESVKQVDHAELAATVVDVWNRAGYSSPAGMRRLHDLWRDDFRPVTLARAPEAGIDDFTALRPYVGEAVSRIRSGYSPVIVVNGAAERDYVQEDLDFQAGSVWKILVGGTKLSRGFTVEGLTTTYYTRRTVAADTLMQMGRWFGYRPGYHDLVRLYIGRYVPGQRKSTTVDLYRAFEAIVKDEEDFRDQLRQYQGARDDGHPMVRPIDVPPLVFQSLPWLTPTGRNKMYNARLTRQGDGGKVRDFFQQPDRDPQVNATHFAAVRPLLDAASNRGPFFHVIDVRDDEKPVANEYAARYGIVDTDTVLAMIREFHWAKRYSIAPTLNFIEKAHDEGTLTDWAVIVPELASSSRASASVATRYVDGERLDILKRRRRDDREGMFSGSSPRQRDALEIISGGGAAPEHKYRAAFAEILRTETKFRHLRDVADPRGTRGAILLTFSADRFDDDEPRNLPDQPDPGEIASMFSLAMPYRSAPGGRVAFEVKFKDERATYDVDLKGSGG